jgi:hypothetical protein
MVGGDSRERDFHQANATGIANTPADAPGGEAARGWIFDRAADGVFSFANVCETLEIDGEQLRNRIHDGGAAAVESRRAAA